MILTNGQAQFGLETRISEVDGDLPVLATDNRRLEVVVDGLPLYGGCQFAIDTTLVCCMHCNGSPHQGAAERDGVVLTMGGGCVAP